eukprot:TRINITY_DN6194_c0_g1_i2.p1 TRINITY_DN6194_c0_g1~~TRINITY_DN6194_c0_g1_i2.p1  ORF type:complete len:284 (-),score=65.61 TRINITY_DN6194_c0_g1_i2:47-898(-)
MLFFGLEEIGNYEEAEKVSLQALEINKNDAWAVHAYTHVLEMQGRQIEGIQFLEKTFAEWTSCNNLACHLFWHWFLHLIELGKFEDALSLYDKEISKRVNSGAMLDLVDGSSALFRLYLEGYEVEYLKRREHLFGLWKSHLDDHVYLFNDVHIAMTINPKDECCTTFKNTLHQYSNPSSLNENNTNQNISNKVGENITLAVIHFLSGDFEKALQLIEPSYLNNQIVTIGGSNAQRDIFNLLYFHSLINSKKREKSEIEKLLGKRKSQKKTSGINDRLFSKLNI